MKPEVASSSSNRSSLVVDGSGTSVFVGLIGTDGEWVSKISQASSPLESLFPSVKAVLNSTPYQISDVDSFIYCEGPGSILGLRLCAMAVQTWGHLCKLPVRYFSYNSLELTAALIILDNPDVSNALLVSDWKKDVWNSIEIAEGKSGAVTTIDNQMVNSQKDRLLFYLPQRKVWQKVPERANVLEYSPQRLSEALQLLKETKKIELYASSINVFKKWIPQRHRTPV